MKVDVRKAGKLWDVEVTLDSGFKTTFEQCEFGRETTEGDIRAWAIDQATIAETRASDPALIARRAALEAAQLAEAQLAEAEAGIVEGESE